jgi:hypothetical protein
LDPTTEKGILVGYNETSKAYRVYIPSSRKTVERRDIKFEEERAFRKSYQTKIFWKQKFLSKKKYHFLKVQIFPQKVNRRKNNQHLPEKENQSGSSSY